MVNLGGDDKANYVARMFDRIAQRYDRLNAVMSLGMHHYWRGQLAKLASSGIYGEALDIATGTGDSAIALLKQSNVTRVIGLDFSSGMLGFAREKVKGEGLVETLDLIKGDALRLPFGNDIFSCVTIAWGLRNLADYSEGLREMVRVVKSNGRVAILDMTPLGVPKLLRGSFRWYFHHVTPLLGRWLANEREAYAYLPDSVDVFPDAEKLRDLMIECGMQDVKFSYCGFGTQALHVGTVI